MTNPAISTAIRELLDTEPYQALSAKAINRGSCHMFAMDVMDNCPSATLVKTGNEPVTGNVSMTVVDEPAHICITDGQKHYDAETPEGVKHWKQLPLFQRTLDE